MRPAERVLMAVGYRDVFERNEDGVEKSGSMQSGSRALTYV